MRSMRARGANGLLGAQSLPDMTPMVDVVMVILIFFMASSTLAGSELFLRARVVAEAEVRASETAPLLKPAALVIRLSGAGQGARASGLGVREVTVEGMLARIAARGEALRAGAIPVMIEAGPEVAYQRVVDVMVALERVGVREVGIR